jgi:KaiC/GvpD/RAD55 family RecA-like ATPase
MADIVSIGIERLDEALIDGKGITMGSSVLIQGSSGSGKELLAKQFASAGIGSENVVYFSTDETSDELIETFEQYRWPTDLRIVNVGTQYFEKVLSRELQASRFKQEGLSVAELRNIGSYGSTVDQINFVADMTYEISKLRAPFRVVIDSLDFFLQYYDPIEVLSAMRTIKEYAQANGGTVMYTITDGAHETRLQSQMEAISDVVIQLEVGRMAAEFENRLIIKKIRNHPEKAAVMIYAVTEHGITPEMITRVA